MNKRIFILGSTGSIGCNVLKVIKHLQLVDLQNKWEVVGLSAKSNSKLLQEQSRQFNVSNISISSGETFSCKKHYSSSEDLILENARPGDIVVGAIVGFAGIAPIMTAIKCGCDIALANKETLVAAGALIMQAVSEANVQLTPIDSEHSAIFQSLSNHPNKEIERITLTASGGALRKFSVEEVRKATVEQVLNHPVWSMGAKVTVDSASLMNKALELVEAHWLFNVNAERLNAVIHPQSIVHGMVEFIDGSIVAQLSSPDMKLPIQYSLTYPNRLPGCSSKINWLNHPNLGFEPIDFSKYPAVRLAYDVIRQGGTSGAVFNAANEVVVESFLEQSLPFESMVSIVEKVLGTLRCIDCSSFDSIVEADNEARELAKEYISSVKTRT